MHLLSEHQNTQTKPDRTEKQKIVKCTTIIDGNFKTHPSILDITSRQNISKDIENLNNTIKQLDLTDIYRILHPIAEYTSFSSTYRTINKTDYILITKQVAVHFKGFKSQKVSCLITTELESITKILGKIPNTLKLSNIFLNNPWVQEEIKRQTRSILN